MADITTGYSGSYAAVDHYELPVGGANPVVHLFLYDGALSPVRPKLDLSPRSDHQASYLSPDDNKPASLLLVPGPVDDDRCGFWEVDRRLMPGLYGLQLPPYLRCRGYTFVHLSFAGARSHYLEIHGVEYNPYDTFALGLTTWIRSACHEHLTSGLRKSMPATLQPLLVDWFRYD